VIARPELAEVLTGERAEGAARRRLNTSVWRLRRALEPDGRARSSVVVTQRVGLAISPDCDVCVDVEEFERAHLACARTPVDAWTTQDATTMSDAVDLYRDDLMVGSYEEWVLSERARLTNLHLDGLSRLMRWHRDRGDLERAVSFGERALAREPLREDIHRHLIAAYAAAGQRATALAQFDRCRTLLADELGIEPMPETTGRPSPSPTCHRSTPSCSATTTTATTSTTPAEPCCRPPMSSSPPRRGPPARRQRRRPQPLADHHHRRRRRRPPIHHGDRDPGPARPTAQPPHHQRRHRLRPRLGGPGARRALDLWGHRAV
jgi:DNA-binding SARP family transcriptional activator